MSNNEIISALVTAGLSVAGVWTQLKRLDRRLARIEQDLTRCPLVRGGDGRPEEIHVETTASLRRDRARSDPGNGSEP